MSHLNITLFGSPRLEQNNHPVTIDIRKGMGLLAYLAVTQTSQSRETLATLLWPEHDQQHARAALRSVLWSLNKELANNWLVTDRDTVSLNLTSNITIDVLEFEAALAHCQTQAQTAPDGCAICIPLLTQAVELYQADFLAGFTLRDSAAFDEWQSFQAESLRQKLAGALERLIYCHDQQNDLESALAYARRWLDLDPLNETVHRQLMHLYVRSGQRAAAFRQYLDCVQILAEELDTVPSSETLALYEAIQDETVEIDLVPPSLPNLPTPSPPVSLPTPPTAFIGRKKALTEIAHCLADSACRLLTLIGPGGIGKTRLAIQAATDALARDTAARAAGQATDIAFPHGVHFVRLSSLSDPESAPDTLLSNIVDTLKFSFYGSQSLQDKPQIQLLNYLREKRLLLVIDNFETYLTAVDLLIQIQAHAPDVKLIVTSRERLNLQGEWLFEVRGMQYPQQPPDPLHNQDIYGNAVGLADQTSLAQISPEEYGAIKLFLECARRSERQFTLSPQDWPYIIQICQLVEGLPLAIELAATWVRLLSLPEIVQEIKGSLDFLQTSLRDLPERHQSLGAVFEGSWQLLPPPEQEVFRQMSVFRRGFQREAAEIVAGATLATLSALVDKSLLSKRIAQHAGTAPRYEMHSILKQYAAAKLSVAEKAEVEARHGYYYATYLHQRALDSQGGRQTETLTEIGIEIANLRASWRWAITHQPQPALIAIDQALDNLYRFYEIRSWFQEGHTRFKQAVDCCIAAWPKIDQQPDHIRQIFARLVARQGIFAYRLSAYEEGQILLKRGLTILRTLDKNEGLELGLCLNHLGNIAYMLADYPAAEQYYQASLDLRQELGDDYGISDTLNNMGVMAHLAGDYIDARRRIEKSLAIGQKIDNPWCMAFALSYLGQVANACGDYDQAAESYQRALTICREIGERFLLATTLGHYGYLMAEQGDLSQAKALMHEGLAIQQEIGNKRGIASALNDLGNVFYREQDYDEANQFLQQSLALRRDIDDLHGVAICLDNLGDVAAKLGDYTVAKTHFYNALSTALQIQAIPLALDILVGLSRLLTQKRLYPHEDGRTKAVELLNLVKHHPASEQETRDQALSFLMELSVAEKQHEDTALAKDAAEVDDLKAIAAQVVDMLA